MVAGEFYNKQYDKLTNIFTLLLNFIIFMCQFNQITKLFY